MSLEPGALIGRYRIVARLGGGGMGEVHLAHDTALERDVALKVITSDAARDPSAVRRFTREAQAASALNHPNIISVFDVGDCDAGPFIIMELVDGRTLRHVLPIAAGLDTLIQIGRQVARALAAAHAAGIVHRDIKPENVMVRADGYVKVLDFGVARVTRAEADRDAPTTDASPREAASNAGTGEAAVGTAAYMSPEQARGERVGSATDIFALGLVFYEMVASRHPFAAPDKITMVARMQSELPLPPSWLNSEVPPSFDALILRMLARDPRARPDAGEVDRTLAALSDPGATVRPPTAVPTRHTVGHDLVRAELTRAFDVAEAGRGALVALSGEPGIGKTTLAEDFLRELVASGRSCLVARGRCSERQAEAGAYLPWLEALDSMRDETGSSVARVMQTLAPTWYAQVAPLAAGDSAEARAVTVNRAGSQEWMKRELSTFLEEVARQRPLVLCFDDLHWADGSTVELLAYLGTRLPSMRVLVIGTYRPTDLQLARHPFLHLKLELESRAVCRDIRVGFLTAADVERYLGLEFPGHAFPSTLAALVHAKTEGNPLFMADLVRSLCDRDVIRHEAGVWRLAQAVPDFERDVPASIRSMIDLKITRLDDADRRLLTAAGVQGYEFDSGVVSRTLGIDQGDVEDRLDALGRMHGLVQPVREVELPDRTLSVKYRFVHVLYQNALYGSLGPSRRASLSAAVAAALVAMHGDQVNQLASELAYLFEAARDFSRAAEFFLIASERARQVFADREALALARRGMEMLQKLPDTPDRAPRELTHLMGIALPMQSVQGYAAPALEEAYGRARQLRDALGENPQLFGIVAGMGAFHFMRAELSLGEAEAGRMLRMSEQTRNPFMLIWAEWAYGATFSHLGPRPAEALRHLDRGVSLYDPSMHPDLMVMTGLDAGIACHFQGARVEWMLGHPARAADRVDRTTLLAKSLRHPLMIGFSLFFQGWVRQHARNPDGVLEVSADALRLCEQYGYPHLGAWTHVLHGWALSQTGRPEEGEAMIRQAIGVTDMIGLKLMRPNFLALLAESLAIQDRVDEALPILAEARTIAERTSEACYLPEILRLTGALMMRKGPTSPGDVDEVERVLRAAGALAQQHEAPGFELRAATTLAAFARKTGRAADARAGLARVTEAFTEGFETPDYREAQACLAGF